MGKRSSGANRPPRLPSYCRHRASGQAYIKVRGKVIYLGVYGSEASQAAYSAAIAAVLAGREIPRLRQGTDGHSPTSLTIRELCDRFTAHAAKTYLKGGKPTSEVTIVSVACKRLTKMIGDHPASSFGPLTLKAFRETLVADGLARSTVNALVSRIRRAFRWAAGEELIPASVPHALATVDGLRAGRSDARETPPVLPVADEIVDRTVEALPSVVADMVRVQRLTGMRPGEVCALRPCDLDRTGDVWKYRPASHKTEHYGRERVVFLGPRAQSILLKYLARNSETCCFRPCDSEAKRRAALHAARVTPLSCGARPGSNVRRTPEIRPGDQYSVGSYRQAITRACKRAGVERWRPNQLRHTTATEVRARFGLDAAQTVLGHASAKMSEHYAEKDRSAAAEVARAIG